LVAITGSAQASWIQVVDPNLLDTATNPGFGAGGPSSQSASNVRTWLQDLLDAAAAPPLLGQNDSFSAASISGLPSAGSLYITLHYGNYLVGGSREQNVTVAYSCTTGCSTFSGYTTQALSNYREYGTVSTISVSGEPVPLPSALALLGIGMLGLGVSRRTR
jgi:hypothetical protein